MVILVAHKILGSTVICWEILIFKVLKNKQLEPTASVRLFSELVYQMNPPLVILQSTQLELPILQSTEAEGKRKAFLPFEYHCCVSCTATKLVYGTNIRAQGEREYLCSGCKKATLGLREGHRWLLKVRRGLGFCTNRETS